MCLMPGPEAEMRSDKTGVHKVHKDKVGVLLPRVEEEAGFQAKKREGA